MSAATDDAGDPRRGYFDALAAQWDDEEPSAESMAARLDQYAPLLGLRPGHDVLEAGCGTGNHARYFAAHGFDVTGVDIAPTAVGIARRNAAAEGLDCSFLTADLTADPPAFAEKFDFAWEWEVLHHIAPALRPAWVRNLHHLLNPGAAYISVCFSEDDEQFGSGKMRRTPIGTTLYFSSEDELRALFAAHFAIEELRTMRIPGTRGAHAVIYAQLFRA